MHPPDMLIPEDYSAMPAYRVVMDSMRGWGRIIHRKGVYFKGRTSEGATFSFLVCTTGQGMGLNEHEQFHANSLPIRQRSKLLEHGRLKYIAGVVVRMRSPLVSMWLWVPWFMLSEGEKVCCTHPAVKQLGPLDGLIDFAAITRVEPKEVLDEWG